MLVVIHAKTYEKGQNRHCQRNDQNEQNYGSRPYVPVGRVFHVCPFLPFLYIVTDSTLYNSRKNETCQWVCLLHRQDASAGTEAARFFPPSCRARLGETAAELNL